MIPKYRAWIPDTNQMGIVLLMDFFNKEVHWAESDYDSVNREPNYAAFSDIILMQWTGLQDKNGVDVYEDDYIKVYYPGFDLKIIKQVEYLNGFWCGECPLTEYRQSSIEVIGNIYQNPELKGVTE